MSQSPSASDSPRESSRRLPRLLGTLYFIILALIIGYIWLVAQDRFLSSATFKISRQNPGSGDISIAALALPGLSDTGSVDSQVAIGFVNSTDLLLDLENQFDLRQHYASPSRDIIFRLPLDSPLEQRLKYYRKRISAHFDKETGLTVLTVDTFDPALSRKIAQVMLQRIETFVNALNQSVADQQLAFIRGEVERSAKQVEEVTAELLALQNEHNLVNPDEVISANLRALQELRMSRLRTETTLASIERDSPESPRIETLRSHLRSLDEQIALESTKISGPEQDRLNQVLSRFKELQLKLQNVISLRTSAEMLLEKYRRDAAARSRFLSIIQKPFMPEDVGYPRRGHATATILILGFLLFLILRVLASSVCERAG